MHRVKIFFAYQFADAMLNKIERESYYTEALEAVNSALAAEKRAVEIQWEYWNIESGVSLNREIFERMDATDIFVFDLSDENRNVYIELGYALFGVRHNGKQIIILLHDEKPIGGIPSDMAGIFVLKVNKNNLLQKLTKELFSKINKISYSDKLIKRFFETGFIRGFHLIFPELPNELRSQFARGGNPNYLRYTKFADLDTLFYLRGRLSELEGKSQLMIFTGEEYFLDNDALQVIVGGPAWNRLSRLAQVNLPLRFEDGGDGNDDPVIESVNPSARFVPELDQGAICSDVSYIARFSRGPGRRTIMLSGCRTYGVLGAAKALLEESVALSNHEWLYRNFGEADFVLAFRSNVTSGEVIAEHFDTDNILSCFKKTDKKFARVSL